MVYCCCPPRDDYSNCFCCLPLGLAGIFYALLLALWGSWEIAGSVLASYFPDFGTVVHLIVGCLYCLCALMGLLSIILRNACLSKWVAHGWSAAIGVAIFFLIYSWIAWGLQLGGIGTPNGEKWKPNADEITMMVISTVFSVLLIVSGWWIIGTLNSLTAVFAAGGSGWEGKNAELIRAGSKAYEDVDDDDDDSEA